MPDKRNESKIYSILERRGIIERRSEKKVGEDSTEVTADDLNTRYDSDIKPIISTADDSGRVSSTTRQPVPGMPSPVFTAKTSDEIMQEMSQPTDVIGYEDAFSAPPQSYEQEYSAPAQSPVPDYYTPPPAPIAPQPAEPQKPTTVFGNLNPFRSTGAPDETVALEPVAREREAQPENYTDRYLNIKELYDALALRSKKTDTVYLIEEYLQTLPDSLPDSSRRDIVNKLLSASGFDYDLLMGDGVLRVKMLKEYAERFAKHTDDYIAARQAELEEMEQRSQRTRKLIENRKELHKKQFFTIEAEAQRLKEILTFISG